jgi:hypothetical protein
MCVLTLIYVCPHTTICVSSYYYLFSYYYVCPHTTICVSSYSYNSVLRYQQNVNQAHPRVLQVAKKYDRAASGTIAVSDVLAAIRRVR